jgi:hypothetical protein
MVYQACTRHLDAVAGVQPPYISHNNRTRRTNAVRRVQIVYAAHRDSQPDL